jgi:hypothetical protein
MFGVIAAQRRDASSIITVDNPTFRQRRQGVNCNNKPRLTWTAKHEAKGQTAWSLFIGGADREAKLQIETSGDSTLTPYASCVQPSTMLCHFATTSCPYDCSSKGTTESVTSPTYMLFASSRYPDYVEANTCSSWHSTCLAPVERGASNYGVSRCLGDAPMTQVCQDSCLHRLHARLPCAHSCVLVSASIKEPRPRRSASQRPQHL